MSKQEMLQAIARDLRLAKKLNLAPSKEAAVLLLQKEYQLDITTAGAVVETYRRRK